MALNKITALSVMALAGGIGYLGFAANASATPLTNSGLINSGLAQAGHTAGLADLGQKIGYRGRGGFLQFYIGPRHGYRHNYRRGHRYGYRRGPDRHGYRNRHRGDRHYYPRRGYRGYGYRSYGGHSGGYYGGGGRLEGYR